MRQEGLFDVVIKELKEKEVPELNDEFAQSLGNAQFDTLEAVKEKIREQLRQREEQSISARLGEQITEKLLRHAQFEVSSRVVDAEADRMAENLKLQFERQGMRFDAAHFDSPEFRTGYRLQAEKNIRTRLVLDKIAVIEQISLTDEDTEGLYREVARAYGMDPQK